MSSKEIPAMPNPDQDEFKRLGPDGQEITTQGQMSQAIEAAAIRPPLSEEELLGRARRQSDELHWQGNVKKAEQRGEI